MFWKDLNVLLTSDVKYDWVFFQVFVDFLEDLNFNIATGLSEVMIHFFFNLPMQFIKNDGGQKTFNVPQWYVRELVFR